MLDESAEFCDAVNFVRRAISALNIEVIHPSSPCPTDMYSSRLHTVVGREERSHGAGLIEEAPHRLAIWLPIARPLCSYLLFTNAFANLRIQMAETAETSQRFQ